MCPVVILDFCFSVLSVKLCDTALYNVDINMWEDNLACRRGLFMTASIAAERAHLVWVVPITLWCTRSEAREFCHFCICDKTKWWQQEVTRVLCWVVECYWRHYRGSIKTILLVKVQCRKVYYVLSYLSWPYGALVFESICEFELIFEQSMAFPSSLW